MEGARIDTGIPGMNRVLGAGRMTPDVYGLHCPGFYLFGGGPGAGKTTLLLHMASTIVLPKAKPDGEDGILYISSEQPPEEINANARGLGLLEKLRHLRVWYSRDINDIMIRVKKMNPKVIVYDSLNKLEDPVRDTGERHKNKVAIAKTILDDAFKNDRGVIAISHLNKEDDFAGFRELQHDVGAAMLLTRVGLETGDKVNDAKRKRKSSMRMLQCPEKNRYGDIEERAFFRMGKRTFEEVPDPDGKDGEVEEIGL